MFVYFALILQVIPIILANREEECWTEGACFQSVMIDETAAESPAKCENECINTPDCSWFTFYGEFGLCSLLTECVKLTPEVPNAISGQSKCNGEPECGLQGRCTGTLVSVAKAETPEACQQICQGLNEDQ